MDQFVKEKFEQFFSQKWSDDRNSYAYDDIIFELENNKYKFDFVQKSFEAFEAGYDVAKEIYCND
jgi:hypothetical protein